MSEVAAIGTNLGTNASQGEHVDSGTTPKHFTGERHDHTLRKCNEGWCKRYRIRQVNRPARAAIRTSTRDEQPAEGNQLGNKLMLILQHTHNYSDHFRD